MFSYIGLFLILYDHFAVLQFVEMLVRNLKESLKTGEWEKARMMVRFGSLIGFYVKRL